MDVELELDASRIEALAQKYLGQIGGSVPRDVKITLFLLGAFTVATIVMKLLENLLPFLPFVVIVLLLGKSVKVVRPRTRAQEDELPV